MRQERRRRLASPMNQRTMDSWDFGSTTVGSRVPSVIVSSPKFTQNTKILSIDPDRDHHDKHSQTEIHAGFVEGGCAKTPHGILITDEFPNPPLPVPDTPELEQGEGGFLLSRSPLPSLSPSPNAPSESSLPPFPSAGPGTNTRAGQFGVQLPPPPTTPTPVHIADSVSMHRESSVSPPSALTAVPKSAPPSTSPSFWNRLTQRPSRSALADDDSTGYNKGKGISRFLAKRGSSSLVRPSGS
jgi:serine/threonine-protein kinase OSR1/STK39